MPEEQGIYCPACDREHQPRERATTCVRCGRETWDVHRMCDRCVNELMQVPEAM